jgi:hypothetical protein
MGRHSREGEDPDSFLKELDSGLRTAGLTALEGLTDTFIYLFFLVLINYKRSS